MNSGVLTIVGVGPGDPELLTLKAVRVLQQSSCVYVPVSRLSRQTWLDEVARRYAPEQAEICPVTFSVAADSAARSAHWETTAAAIDERLQQGQKVAFVTLGDPQLYSTSLYLLRALRRRQPQAAVEIVPGISSFSHCAALTGFNLGIGTAPVTILPTVTALGDVRRALATGGTLVLMKIGRQLDAIIELLEELQLVERAVFVARAGFPEQVIETDLRRLRGAPAEQGHLAVILIDTEG